MTPDKRSLDELRIDRSAKPRKFGWYGLIAVVFFFLVLVLVVGLAWELFFPKPAEVRTVVVQSSSNPQSDETLLNASGYVTARREATVSSKITGKVMEVRVEEGSQVEAGQELARLDDANATKNVHLAEAQWEASKTALEETKAGLRQARRELDRLARLATEKILSASELDRAEADVQVLEARLKRQHAEAAVVEQQVALWKQELDDTIIRAPFAGVVTSKNAQPGEMISPMSAGGFTRTGICTIVDMESLEIEVDVSESYINRVEAGQPVVATLDAYPDWRIPARVVAIIPTADRQKATVKVRVGFDALDPRILPEMSVKVAFQSGEERSPSHHAIQIPKSALHREGSLDFVWIVRGGRVERRAISIETLHKDKASVVAGLNGGERIVVQGSENLADGDRITENRI